MAPFQLHISLPCFHADYGSVAAHSVLCAAAAVLQLSRVWPGHPHEPVYPYSLDWFMQHSSLGPVSPYLPLQELLRSC